MMAVSGHSHRFQTLIHPLPNIFCGNTQIFWTKSHIFFYNCADDLIIRILKNHAGLLTDIPDICIRSGIHVIHPQSSLCRHQQTVDMFCQRGLSASVMS